MAGHPFFYEVSFCWICGTYMIGIVPHSLFPLRCGTNSTRTVRGSCWFMTWAWGRVLMPSTAGWGRWNRKWALRPIWTVSCSSCAPTRSALCCLFIWDTVEIRWWHERKCWPGRDTSSTRSVSDVRLIGTVGLKQPDCHVSSQVDLTKRRVVDEGEGRLWAESRGFHYFETSAQSGEGINEMFQVCLCFKNDRL